MENKQSLLSRVLYNNKLMIVLSLLISFIIWLAMCMNVGEEITTKITGIPISITLSDEATASGLKNFTEGELTADVMVKGNRLSVGSLTAADIEVVATQASTISSPGTYTLELSAKKIGLNTNYELTSTIYPSTVIVTIDRFREVSFPLINNLNYSIADGYYEGTTGYSSNEITVSGAETEVSRIDKVAVIGDLEDELTETTTVSQKVVLLDEYGEQISSDKMNLSEEFVDVTIPVDYKKKLKMTVALEGANGYLSGENGIISISPAEIEVAGPYEEINDASDVTVATVNMAELNTSTSVISTDVELPSGWKNLSNITSVSITFDFTGFTSKTIKIKEFDTSELSVTSNADVTTQEIEVTVIGKSSELSRLTADKIKASIDFGNKAKGYSGTAELPVVLEIESGFESCWVYGNYTASVNVVSNAE